MRMRDMSRRKRQRKGLGWDCDKLFGVWGLGFGVVLDVVLETFIGLDLNHFIPIQNISDEKVLDYFTAEELNIFEGYVERHNQLIIEKDFDEFGIFKIGLSNK